MCVADRPCFWAEMDLLANFPANSVIHASNANLNEVGVGSLALELPKKQTNFNVRVQIRSYIIVGPSINCPSISLDLHQCLKCHTRSMHHWMELPVE